MWKLGHTGLEGKSASLEYRYVPSLDFADECLSQNSSSSPRFSSPVEYDVEQVDVPMFCLKELRNCTGEDAQPYPFASEKHYHLIVRTPNGK